jgi:ABC-type multidrug transport system ATPase subunit
MKSFENPTSLRFFTEDFRAIKSADIVIDGITLVAGVNGCGKSTLSKLVYYLYKTLSNYENLVSEKLHSDLRDVARFLEIAQSELYKRKFDRSKRIEFRKEFESLTNSLFTTTPNEKQLILWLNFVEKIEISASLDDSMNPEVKKRLFLIVRDLLSKYNIKESNSSDNPFELLKHHIKSLFKESFGIIESRSIGIFKNQLMNVFHTKNLPKKFDVYEYGQQIVGLNKHHISLPYTIQEAIYIDTPMMLGVDVFDNNHWEDLNELLKKSDSNSFSQISDLISNDIIGGEAKFDDGFLSINEFVYQRKDGSIFNLLDCATGIKSFSIIQLLLKNNSLNDKTLLVIDEPESNLHPQWIIEYARLIVLLNKNLGIKFFIASHNPDMVSAIKIIAEKENNISTVNFYLAEKTNEFSYKYRHLGNEIDPIFESFNIAFERMSFYGTNTDSEQKDNFI